MSLDLFQFAIDLTIFSSHYNMLIQKSNQRGLFKLFTRHLLLISNRSNNVKETAAEPEPSFGKDPKPFLVLIYKATLEQNTLVLIYKVRCNSQKLLNDAQSRKNFCICANFCTARCNFVDMRLKIQQQKINPYVHCLNICGSTKTVKSNRTNSSVSNNEFRRCV